MNILIVDDSRAMRAIVRRHLVQAGFEHADVQEFENGQEALDAVRASLPTVILSDWNMPVMTGIELLRTLRAEGVDVPLGFVTSESSDEFKEQAFDAGAAFMITKPFTADDFSRCLAPFS